jgi:hypothetical protein
VFCKHSLSLKAELIGFEAQTQPSMVGPVEKGLDNCFYFKKKIGGLSLASHMG